MLQIRESELTASMFEPTEIAENEVCRLVNATVETGSYAVNTLETGGEDPVVWEPGNPLGLNVGISIDMW
jgi:hypothetical protein